MNEKPRGLHYYPREINELVPIGDVIRAYTGNEPRRNGTIKCPIPSAHKNEDKTPSAKIYEDNNVCRCFTCNTSYRPIDVVVQVKGLPFQEACQMLIDDFNLPMERVTNIKELENAKIPGNRVKPFPITFEEAKFLDLDILSTREPNPAYRRPITVGIRKDNSEEVINWYDSQNVFHEQYDVEDPDFDYVFQTNEGEYYNQPKYFEHQSLSEIWKEDPQFVRDLILQKCEKLEKKVLIATSEYNSLFKSSDILKKAEQLQMNVLAYQQQYHKDPVLTPAQTQALNKLERFFDLEKELDQLYKNGDPIAICKKIEEKVQPKNQNRDKGFEK